MSTVQQKFLVSLQPTEMRQKHVQNVRSGDAPDQIAVALNCSPLWNFITGGKVFRTKTVFECISLHVGGKVEGEQTICG